MSDKEIRDSMTSEQILLERRLTCEAINGAIAFGYQGNNPPPSDDHWLAPFWKIGRDLAPTQGADARPADKPHTYWTYCTPRDNDGLRFMIVFDDADRSPIVLPDGNEEKARELFARLEMNWNCHLFELAKRGPVGADARPAQSPGLDKFLFVPPNSEAESGWNAAIVHVTAHIQSTASDVTADARPVAMDAAFDALTEWPSMTPRAVFYAGWEKALATRATAPSLPTASQIYAAIEGVSTTRTSPENICDVLAIINRLLATINRLQGAPRGKT